MREPATPNARAALAERRAAGALTWSGPVLMLFARSAFAVAAQGLVAAIHAARGSASPWREAAAWLPVYGSLIDAGCLWLLWLLARREGIRLRDLIGFDRARLGRDLLLGLALIPPSLCCIFAGIYASSLLVYGDLSAPQIYAPLPLLPALYGALVWPLLWGLVEQTTYNGYLLPRFRALSGSTGFAIAVVGFSWSFQHVVMPLTFDPDFMLYRLVAPVPQSVFAMLVYLRIRRIVPLAVAHALMDGASAFILLLWPLLR
jgi:hypothetical protein